MPLSSKVPSFYRCYLVWASPLIYFQDLPDDLKRRHELKKMCMSMIASEFPEDCKFYLADRKDELHKVVNYPWFVKPWVETSLHTNYICYFLSDHLFSWLLKLISSIFLVYVAFQGAKTYSSSLAKPTSLHHGSEGINQQHIFCWHSLYSKF